MIKVFSNPVDNIESKNLIGYWQDTTDASIELTEGISDEVEDIMDWFISGYVWYEIARVFTIDFVNDNDLCDALNGIYYDDMNVLEKDKAEYIITSLSDANLLESRLKLGDKNVKSFSVKETEIKN